MKKISIVLLSLSVAFSALSQTTPRASQIKNTPAGGISATNVQSAINELDTEKTDKETFTTLTFGSTTNWDQNNRQSPLAKVTATGNFTINMTNVKDGAVGTFKLITNTASAITMTFDTDFTNKTLNTTFTTYTFPAATSKEYFLYFTVDGTTIEWNIVDKPGIADPGGSNDDILQLKSGAWANRTVLQYLSDLAFVVDVPIHSDALEALTLTNMVSTEAAFPNAASNHFTWFDASRYKSVRLVAKVSTLSASANSPRIYLKYATSDGGAFTVIGAGTIASNEAISLETTGVKKTNWITLPAGAIGDIIIAVVEIGGDGVADPVVGNLHVQFKTN